MSANLADIIRSCDENTSKGLESFIQIACIQDVDVIAAAVDKVVATDVTFVGTAGFYKWGTAFEISKNTWKVESIGDRDNTSFKTTVSVFIPGINAARTKVLEAMNSGCGALVGIEDKAENVRLVGDKKTPATVRMTEDNNGDTNGYTVLIEWDSGYVPNFYTGTFPAPTA